MQSSVFTNIFLVRFLKRNFDVYCINMAGTILITAAHYKKIDLSDAIYIVNIGGYIGQSVTEEIAYAKSRGKEIVFHEPM